MGDVILTSPALRAIKNAYPQVEITFMIQEAFRSLFHGHPLLHRLLTIRGSSWRQGLSLLAEVKRMRFDVVVIAIPDLGWNGWAYLSGIPYRLGYADEGGFFLTHPMMDDREITLRHETDAVCRLLHPLDIPIPQPRLPLDIVPPAHPRAMIAPFFATHGLMPSRYVVIHPGAFRAHVRWPAPKFTELIGALSHDPGLPIIVIGDQREQSLVTSIVAPWRSTGRVMAWIQPPLPLLLALLQEASLFIGNASGPLHAAAALGTPCVAIFGACHPLDSPARWAPSGDPHIILTPPEPYCGIHPADLPRADRYFDGLTAPQVIEAARKLLA